MSHNCDCGCSSHSSCSCGGGQVQANCQPKIKMVYCVMPQQASLTLHVKKIDACTGDRIQGACIEICDQYGRCAQATTNVAGIVSFSIECGQSYFLKEVWPADGYLPTNRKIKVKVDKKGNITVDGNPYFTEINGVPQFVEIYNEPVCGCTQDMICYVIAEQPIMNNYTGGCGCQRHSCSCCDCC